MKIIYIAFQYFPRWVAPNVMTFVGFLFTALNFVMLSWYDWSFLASTDYEDTTPIPNVVWLCAASFIFLAYTLGKMLGSNRLIFFFFKFLTDPLAGPHSLPNF